MEELLLRHRREKKELVQECTKLKKSASSARQKKEVGEQIAELEAKLQRKHDEELAALTPQPCDDLDGAPEQIPLNESSSVSTQTRKNRRVSWIPFCAPYSTLF